MTDIIVYSCTIHKQFYCLTNIFKTLRKTSLKIQSENWKFLRKDFAYFGRGFNPAKVDCIVNFLNLTNQKDSESFLKLSRYYRRFIPNISKISRLSNKLLEAVNCKIFCKLLLSLVPFYLRWLEIPYWKRRTHHLISQDSVSNQVDI